MSDDEDENTDLQDWQRFLTRIESRQKENPNDEAWPALAEIIKDKIEKDDYGLIPGCNYVSDGKGGLDIGITQPKELIPWVEAIVSEKRQREATPEQRIPALITPPPSAPTQTTFVPPATVSASLGKRKSPRGSPGELSPTGTPTQLKPDERELLNELLKERRDKQRKEEKEEKKRKAEIAKAERALRETERRKERGRREEGRDRCRAAGRYRRKAGRRRRKACRHAR